MPSPTTVALLSLLLLLSLLADTVEANFEDNRCRCICPSTDFFSSSSTANATKAEDVLRKGTGDKSRRYYTKTNINPLSW